MHTYSHYITAYLSVLLKIYRCTVRVELRYIVIKSRADWKRSCGEDLRRSFTVGPFPAL